ncbi:xylan glycosyltransferase MUCI21-like [Phragmites australis]|uniref:xylan glycosyltransferase MUCI21-like n=1 Tax=Phragmites australis TaxID=29695 RepID=UPI002D79C4A7|nr:xylan glycosyltransferase MUCI21-like [Phragmites australis]
MDDVAGVKKGKWAFVQFFFVLCVVLCVLLYAPRVLVFAPYGIDFFAPSSTQETSCMSELGPHVAANAGDEGPILDNQVGSPCSSMRNNTICCDRSDFNTDVCFMAGDVRTDAASLSLLLFPPQAPGRNATAEERVQPYPRKWEKYIMRRIHEVRLRVAQAEESAEHRCDVRHDAPVLVMSAGGYTDNFFHAFNDGLLPSWLTVQHLRRRVVLGVLSYNPSWAGTFSEIISGLSDYRVVDLINDKRTHCFTGAIVGTRFHGILNVEPTRLRDNKTIFDFHQFLADLYEMTEGHKPEKHQLVPHTRRPRLGIVSRKGTRVIENQAAVAHLASSIGFDVDILETANGMPLSAVYASVRACDALVGVHGADLTKFLFLRPGRAALAQIVPLGLSPNARACFGVPSARMWLHYDKYDVRGHESSLSRKYGLDDVVVADPEKAKRDNGWDIVAVARVYLRGQNVSLDLGRFREALARLHSQALLLQRQEIPKR